jgi:hypothetical protein
MIRYILLAANILTWGGLAWLGRHDGGSHFGFYEGIPAAMLIISTLPPIVLWRFGWTRFGISWAVATLCVLPAYLFFYTGGM